MDYRDYDEHDEWIRNRELDSDVDPEEEDKHLERHPKNPQTFRVTMTVVKECDEDISLVDVHDWVQVTFYGADLGRVEDIRVSETTTLQPDTETDKDGEQKEIEDLLFN